MKFNRRHTTLIILAVMAFICTSIIPSFAEVINYTYDDAGRLTRVLQEKRQEGQVFRVYKRQDRGTR